MSRQLLTGWAAWRYVGTHRAPTYRIGHLATGVALYLSTKVR